MRKTHEENSAELDATKILDKQKELRTRFTEMIKFRNVDARVLQTSVREVARRYTLARSHFQRFSFQAHRNTLRTLSALFGSRSNLSKPFHKVKTTSTTRTSCDQLAHIRFAC